MSIANYLENAFLNKVFRNTDFTVATVYFSLHTSDPGETGAGEATGGSYARQSAAFSASVNGTISNSGVVDFTLMPAITVTHWGAWDDPTAGNFLWSGTLSAQKIVNSGDTFRFPAASVTVSVE